MTIRSRWLRSITLSILSAVGVGPLAAAQQVGLDNGLTMTVFDKPARAGTAKMLESGPGRQALRMVVFDADRPTPDTTVAVAELPEPAQSMTAPPLELRAKLSTGYRYDRLNFTIAHPSGSPNVLSELDWRGLRSQQIAAAFDLVFGGGLYLQGNVGGGIFWDGRNRDSDWNGDNRTGEFSRSYADSEGYVFDLSAAIGYAFALPNGNRLSPLVGYALNEQFINMVDGVQSVPASGPFDGLDSTYEARWYGPWLGLRWDYSGDDLEWFAQGEYHWTDYRAEADWNLRSDFQHPVSFRHRTEADGWKVGAGGSYRLTDNLSLTLDADYRNWYADAGKDETFFSNDSQADIPLNGVKWLSYSVNLGVSWRY